MPREIYTTEKLTEIGSAFNLVQNISSPPHFKGHVVHLIFIMNGDKIKPCKTRVGDLNTDHYTVLFLYTNI